MLFYSQIRISPDIIIAPVGVPGVRGNFGRIIRISGIATIIAGRSIIIVQTRDMRTRE